MFPRNQDYTPNYTKDQARALSAFMSSVYLWMMVGIAITGVTAYAVAGQPNVVMQIMQNKILFFGIIILQLVAVVTLSAAIQRMSVTVASLVYALYATLVGLTFSVIFLVYTAESISTTFFITAFAFGGLSLVGYTTKKDLGPIGSFCMIGLFGMIAVMFLGMFFPSMMGNSMQLTMSVIGIFIFAGLTAYDTQRIKNLQFQYTTGEQARKGAIYGALVLYLDFINLFINLLRLMGDRK
jgi:FtsH-binding integral membrane protein